MFKFGKSQGGDSSRNPELLAIPETEDLQFALSKAQRNWRTSVELPFRVQGSSVAFTVIVKCEMGTGVPCWTLYRTDTPGSPILWTHQSNDVLLIHNLISLEYTSAAEKAATASSGTAQIQPLQESSAATGSVELNPHLARLQQLGRYGSTSESVEGSAPPHSGAPGHQGMAQSTPAPNPVPPNNGAPASTNARTDAVPAQTARAEAAQTYLDWLEGQKSPPDALQGAPESGRNQIDEAASQAKLKMSREIKLTRNSVEWSLSRSDTGILTYAAFVYFFENECIRFNRGGLPFSILLFDVRRQSSFATAPLSPESMREVGERMRSLKRQIDVLAHFDEEGFVFILPHTSPEGARLCMERVKQVLLEGESLLSAMDSSSIKFSCGIASMPEDGTTPEDLLMTARKAKQAQEF